MTLIRAACAGCGVTIMVPAEVNAFGGLRCANCAMHCIVCGEVTAWDVCLDCAAIARRPDPWWLRAMRWLVR